MTESVNLWPQQPESLTVKCNYIIGSLSNTSPRHGILWGHCDKSFLWQKYDILYQILSCKKNRKIVILGVAKDCQAGVLLMEKNLKILRKKIRFNSSCTCCHSAKQVYWTNLQFLKGILKSATSASFIWRVGISIGLLVFSSRFFALAFRDST